MDNHPIPQDVTGFQFRLIGNMTVKQFAFLAAGCVLALITYSLPVFILFKILLVPLFAFIGFALGFVPVEGRPMDAMVGYFFKALISPNQYVFLKGGGHFAFDTIQAVPTLPVALPVAVQKKTSTKEASLNKQKELQKLLRKANIHTGPTDTKESAFLSQVMSVASTMPTPVSTPEPETIETPEEPLQPIISLPVSEPTPAVTEKSEVVEDQQAITPIQVDEIPSEVTKAASEEKEEAEITPEVILAPSQPQAALNQFSATMPLPPLPSVSAPLISSDDAAEKKELEREEKELEKEKEELEREKEKIKKEEEAERQKQEEQLAIVMQQTQKVVEDNNTTHEKVLELEKSLQQTVSEKQALEEELKKLKEQLSNAPVTKPTFTPTVVKEEPKQTTQLVRQIAHNQGVKKGVPPTPDVPNILLGVVKDSSGNILPNILIEVKDTDGSPVRAFKTNQLGQFASATPLSNATYTIDFEDPQGKNKFDTIELVVKGEILEPLEVISHDLREELRKQLFS